MAPQTRSQRALRAASNASSTDESEIRLAFDNVMKAISPPSHHSDSACSSPLSPSYSVIMGGLLARAMTPPEDPESSVDEDELNQIYEKCQAMVNHLSGSEEEHQSNASDDSFVNVHGPSVAPSHPPHQDSSQESGVPSVRDIIMCSMARPTTWAMAYQTLGTLQGKMHVRYADLFSVIPSVSGGTHALPDAQEIQLFRQRHLFDSHPANPSIPIAFVVMQNSHFFVAVFDYWLNLAFILGRRIERVPETPHPHYDPLHDDWNTWNGPFYWTRIASLHGFDAIDPTQVDVQVYNWSQNGFDCGPIASFVMESLMRGGLSGDGRPTIHIPPIPCGHRLRLRMLVMVKEGCRRCWEDYCYLSTTTLPPSHIWTQWDDTKAISEDILMDVENQSSGEQHATIVRELNVIGANCLRCQRGDDSSNVVNPDVHSDGDFPTDTEDEGEDHHLPLDAKSQRLRDLLRRYPYVSRARARDRLPPRAAHGHQVEGESTPDDPLEIIQRHKHVKDWSAGTMYRFPRPTPPVYLPAYQGQRWKPFDRRFDEYEGGPVLESLHQDRNCNEIVEEPYYRPGMWTSFRDYGYRLLSSFNQMFYLGPPIRLSDHILQVGVPANYQSSHQIGDHVTARQNSLVNTFVNGRHEDGHHICLDLELDHKLVTPEELEVTVDIDSLIWVTHSLQFNTPLPIYLGPIVEEKAPMHKHNHVYVDILVPQSEADSSAIGSRTEWLTMAFPLCGVPHTVFGALSNAAGTMNVYICFPRMIHRDEMTHKRANRIPKELIRAHADVSSAPYVSLTLKEVQFKARKGGKTKKAGRPKAVPFSMQVLKQIQKTMEAIIREDPSLICKLWFLLLCPGMQGNQVVDENHPVRSRSNAALDWSHMVDRANGELLVDLGISIHPTCDEKLVGLWRLDALEASFGAGGYLRGNAHHTCMLGRYGGIQAEMSQERARQTHIAFRSAYNLAYEVIRPNDNSPTFVMDKDAYALNNDFIGECMQAINMYSGDAKKRSYGVRDEYRMSGAAVEQAILVVPQRMEELLASNPILWIPTKVWLEFMARRIRALQLAQISLKELEPPNLGILTGIICHMIRCTSTTAIILDFHVRESMALLQVSRVCERLGMFFLLDLDLHHVPHLPEVQDHDDLEVLKLMEGKLKRGDGRPAWPRIPPLDEVEQFPIGSRPTWAKLTRTIQLQPWLIMQDWKWSAQLSSLGPVVGKLFVLFTCQLWIQLDATWLTGSEGKPEPTSLEEAIQSWTLNQTFRTIRACEFKACNAEIAGSGGAGRRQSSFAERVNLFFPGPTAGQPSRRSPWNVFWTKPGYIWEYHQVMKNRTPLEEFEVLDHLGRIFSVLQTLPDATKGSEKSPGKTWRVEGEKVVLVTNPKFYKIEGISTEKEQQQARRRASQVVKPRNALQMELLEHAGYDELLASKALILERQRLKEAQTKKS
ncbi:hypothetical protein F5J12DRAFT_786595 [Pisolithus orientalis]|uniref:uncharacterized protein n=1 Tax=Pisolithus orientalis TaxID=936130 RepID=UPI0022255D76|nr:uncharacterized protein F5J12DRAFT_786595 [Pisolithus orientalis]KAI5989786.1 hypothetical protein F5J12DRAFT_786595 [Pisolithus orientalis]